MSSKQSLTESFSLNNSEQENDAIAVNKIIPRHVCKYEFYGQEGYYTERDRQKPVGAFFQIIKE